MKLLTVSTNMYLAVARGLRFTSAVHNPCTSTNECPTRSCLRQDEQLSAGVTTDEQPPVVCERETNRPDTRSRAARQIGRLDKERIAAVGVWGRNRI